MKQNQINHLLIFETIKSAWSKVHGVKQTFLAVVLCLIVVRLSVFGLAKLMQSPSSELLIASSGPMLRRIIIGLDLFFMLTGVTIYVILQSGLIYFGLQRATDVTIRFNMIKQLFVPAMLFRMVGLTMLLGAIQLPFSIFLHISHLLQASISDSSGILSNEGSIKKLLSAFFVVIGYISMVYSVYFIARLSLSFGFILKNKSTLWDAIKASFKATKSNGWRLIWLYIINIVVFIISAIPLGLGLIWAVPYIFINYGEIYKKLSLPTHSVASVS